MRLAVFLFLLAACEKQGPVESTPGLSSSSDATTPVIKAIDAGVATIGTDAVAPTPADAAVAVGTPDAAVRRRDPDRITISDEDARAIADMLTSDGPRVGEDMTKRRPGSDLSRQIEEVRDGGRTVSIGGGGGRGTRGEGDVRTGSASPSDAPSGRISIAAKRAFDDTSLTVDIVVMKIQSAYMAGIKRCYKAQLKQDPAMRGKVTLTIHVNETGRSVSPKAKGFSTAIDDCLSGMMSSWRFPIPKAKDDEATTAAFEITLQLVPD
ncbi:MAG: AgmX/PglI C-terminal domain-containing protein [Deltaproteobacteria bacterium]|nr:AgmX/PglI C-terminal domain-containing protein [Deltaproteobacteria bacterium]